jgi:hypothetical protein
VVVQGQALGLGHHQAGGGRGHHQALDVGLGGGVGVDAVGDSAEALVEAVEVVVGALGEAGERGLLGRAEHAGGGEQLSEGFGGLDPGGVLSSGGATVAARCKRRRRSLPAGD